MNARQRLLAVYRFEKPDKIPLEPGLPRESTLQAWRQQGLPQGADWRAHLWGTLGLEPPPDPPAEVGINLRLLPEFEERVLRRANGHLVVQDFSGAVVEISDRYDFTYLRSPKDFVTRRWHSFPLKTKTDWQEKLAWRYNAADPRRYPADFEQRCAVLNERQSPFSLSIPGPFWQMRDWMGLEALCEAMVEQPEFIEELAHFWAEFVLAVLRPLLERVQVDFIQVNEDMAYKLHSMISPRMVRCFLMPCWQRWGAAFEQAGVGVYSVDSDGYIGELLPLWIEAGFVNTWPVEVAAGNDIVALQARWGRAFSYGGGVDKRTLAAGGEALRAELRRLAPVIAAGGYLPGCDHGVPPDVSWPNFVDYTRLLAQLTGWL